MKILETKKRSIVKSLTWRVLALSNSWFILTIISSQSNFMKALTMNVIAFGLYYLFERLWNKIKYGRYVDDYEAGAEIHETEAENSKKKVYEKSLMMIDKLLKEHPEQVAEALAKVEKKLQYDEKS